MLSPELIEISQDRSCVEFKIIPNRDGPINQEGITTLLSLPVFCNYFPLENIIEKSVKEVNEASGKDHGEFELYFKIAEKRDGVITLDIAKDKMSATMTLSSAWAGKQPNIQSVLQALKSENITMGLSKVQIEKLLKQLTQLKPGETCSDTIAVGKPAIDGKNALLDRKVPLARERLLQPQKKEDGSVDMHDLGSIITVKPGDLLMEKQPATPGEEGYDVQGTQLKPKAGKDCPFSAGDGAEISSANPNHLIATKSGQPVETKTGMQVDDTLNIKNVDVGYGNVDFKGSVLITGDVCEGMQVKATGDITVLGFADSATLNAQGDVIVSKGIIGRQLKEGELSSHISADGQICAQFVQYSQLNAKGDIVVTKQLLHSDTCTDARLTVSDDTGRRGDLIGGIAKAKHGVKAVVIGATADTKTEIFCAMNQEKLKEDLKALEESIRGLVVIKLDAEARVNKLPPKDEWQDDKTMVEQVNMMLEQKQLVTDELAKEEIEFDHIKQEVEGYYKNNYVEATKHIFTNVEINIGKAFNRTQREHSGCCVFNENSEIHFDYEPNKHGT